MNAMSYTGVHRGQKRMLGLLRAVVKAAVSFLAWVLGTQIGSFWKSSTCS